MFYSENFDPKKMSEEELLLKMDQITSRLEWASRFGSPEAVHVLMEMLSALEFEYAERINMAVWKERQSMFPEVIETDPDAPAHVKVEKDKKEAGEKKQNSYRPMIARTSKPVIPGNNNQ